MSYGPLRPDLTPPDLLAAGYALRPHANGGWCWWTRNPRGVGEIYGASYVTLEEAANSARWLMGGARVTVTYEQLTLMEVA